MAAKQKPVMAEKLAKYETNQDAKLAKTAWLLPGHPANAGLANTRICVSFVLNKIEDVRVLVTCYNAMNPVRSE